MIDPVKYLALRLNFIVDTLYNHVSIHCNIALNPRQMSVNLELVLAQSGAVFPKLFFNDSEAVEETYLWVGGHVAFYIREFGCHKSRKKAKGPIQGNMFISCRHVQLYLLLWQEKREDTAQMLSRSGSWELLSDWRKRDKFFIYGMMQEGLNLG